MMKKLFAAALAVLFLLLPAAAIHYDEYETTKVWMNKEELNMCFDTIKLDGPRGLKTQTDIFGSKEGSVQKDINANPLYLTDETAIICSGWAGIKKDGVVITQYGYKTNESAPVFDDSFTVKKVEQAVYNAGGDSRFRITVPLEDNSKPILITLVCKGSDGKTRDVLEFSVNGEYISANSSHIPPTVRVFSEITAKKLNVAVTGGTEYNPVLCGCEFTVNVDLINNISADIAELYIHYDPGLSFVGAEFPENEPGIHVSASAKDDKATRTIRIKWINSDNVEIDCTVAKLTFKPDESIRNAFCHISVDKDIGYIKNGENKISFSVVNGGADVIPCYPGDVNGDGKTGNKDVTVLFRYISDPGTEIAMPEAADVNGDGSKDNKDVVKLFKVASGAEEADIAPLIASESYEEKTQKVENIKSWTFNDGTAGSVIGIYCETEPDAEVLVCDDNGTVLLRERSLYGYFYGRFLLPFEKASQKVYLYARSEGKALSAASRAYTLEYGENAGANAIIGKDSHVFLNFYKSQYLGESALPEAQAQGRMTNIKEKLYSKLDEIRARTGKNTKIIILICTNPATVYHSMQYSEEERGWGDYDRPSSVTQFGEFMKDDENVYMLDMRQILSEHTDKLLFAQGDSHWTQIAGYYGYYLMAQKIKQDFPSTPIYDLETDFDTTVYPGGGDLINFMGASGLGAKAVWASVTPKSEDMKVSSDAPTAYWMGDSYYHNIAPYFDLLFSKVYLNDYEYLPHPPLYCYTLDDLENRKPDYLFYTWTERNVDMALSWFESTIIN